MYTNLNNPANYQLQSFGQDGMRTISTTQPYVEGEYYRVLVATEDSTVSATSMVGDDLVEVDVFAGTTIYGLFTAVSVSLGEVTAYLAGRTDIDDVWAYIRAYGIANGAVIEGEDCAKAAISPLLDKYYAQASLVMVPSLYKTSIVYSERPLSTDGQLTFTRASDATRVNADGLVEKVRTNLLLQSNTFNATWSTFNATVTSGQAGYDGSSNAWKLNETAVNAEHQLKQVVLGLSGVYTFSVSAKAAEREFMIFRINLAGAWTNVFFNLSTGAVFSTGTFISAQITPQGGGWYRCSAVFTNHTGSTVQIQLAENSTSFAYLGTDGYGIYIQNAQLEQGVVATDYIPTTTSARSTFAGITVDGTSVPNVPRLDYSGGATCPSLLLEPQTTALLTYSEQLNNAAWTKNNVIVTTNAATSPDGYQNADTITGNGVTGNHYILQSISATNGQSYTCSIFAKAGTSNYLQLIMGAAPFGGTNFCNYDLSDGTIGSYGGTTSNRFIQSFGNGWYRIGFTCSATSTASGNFFPNLITSKTSAFFESNSTTGSVNVWGANITATSYVQSYVPTLGTTVTRLADDCVKTSATSIIGQTEGVVYFEWDYQNIGSTGGNIPISLDAGSGYNLYFWAKTDGNYLAECFNGGVAQFSFAGSMGSFGTKKIAIAYKNNDFALYINGVLANTDTSGTVPALNRLYIGRFYLSAVLYNISSGIKQVLLFPTRLTNASLAELTTL